MLHVRLCRERRSPDELRLNSRVDHRDDLGDRAGALADSIEDRILPHAAVDQIGAHHAFGLGEFAAMTGEEQTVLAAAQTLQRCKVVAHVAVGRGDDGRVPGHHVIA